MMDESRARMIMHQLRKDKYKVNIFELTHQLKQKERKPMKYYVIKTIEYLAIFFLLVGFIMFISYEQNKKPTTAEEMIKYLQERGVIEK